MTDYISRADAIDAVRYLIYDRQEKGAKPFKWWFIKQRLNAIPSADAEKPCKTCGYYNLECPKDCEYKSADAVPIVYCMDCAKSVPLDEHGALWKCKAHDKTTLRHSYCNNGERKGGDSE